MTPVNPPPPHSIANIDSDFNNQPSRIMKDAKHDFLGNKCAPTQPAVESAALILLKSSEAHLNMIPELTSVAIQVSQQFTQSEDLTGKKLVAVRVQIPIIIDENNECSTKVCKRIVTRCKNPKSTEKYKGRQYICQDCYEKRKIYQNVTHNNLHVQCKSRELAKRVLGFHQTEPIAFHHPYSLSSFVGTEQVYVATFSIWFGTQVLNLPRLVKIKPFCYS